MLKKLQKKNPQLPLYAVDSPEFASYGRIISLDTKEILSVAATLEMPTDGAAYTPGLEAFEALPVAKAIQERFFGTLPAQIGYCCGQNRFLNATEWHTSSEVNIAVTGLVLILAHVWELREGMIDASQFRAFYVPRGTAVEVYATSLHFTPCQVQPEGFGCVVALPMGTNTDLEVPVEDALLFRKNKWIIAHVQNQALLDRGVKPGITGCNYEVSY